jgi:hypothetical protein
MFCVIGATVTARKGKEEKIKSTPLAPPPPPQPKQSNLFIYLFKNEPTINRWSLVTRVVGPIFTLQNKRKKFHRYTK